MNLFRNAFRITLFFFNEQEKWVILCVSRPCGNFGDPQKSRTSAPAVVTKYQKRNSSPLLDHIDIHIEVSRVEYEKLSGNKGSESSESIRTRVQAAHDIQNKRFTNGKATDIVCNADMRIGVIRQFC